MVEPVAINELKISLTLRLFWIVTKLPWIYNVQLLENYQKSPLTDNFPIAKSSPKNINFSKKLSLK